MFSHSTLDLNKDALVFTPYINYSRNRL